MFDSPCRHRILCVAGARPNFMKVAPIIAALHRLGPDWQTILVHTGQHYDASMNDQFFAALGMPEPDANLGVGSGSHACQTADIMRRFEPLLERAAPSAVLVVGDVNSTLACTLVAAKMNIPVIHVEAGLRSFDRTMPEEINRVVTDQLSALLFTSERSARQNLLREGIDERKIHFVGNVMIDTLHHHLGQAVPPALTLEQAGAALPAGAANGYIVLTLHRSSNVDHAPTLRGLLEANSAIAARIPVIFPVHPRTAVMIDRFGLQPLLDAPGIRCLPPTGYFEMLGLLKHARIVLTDSGGIQEETTALGVPCLTLRDNTERPITITEGTNTLAGSDPHTIVTLVDEVLHTGGKAGTVPDLWDGKAAMRIAQTVQAWRRQAIKEHAT